MGDNFVICRDTKGRPALTIPFAFVMVFITITVTLVSAAATYGALDNRVSSLENEWDNAGPRHTEVIDDLETRLDSLEQLAARTDVSLSSINKNVEEIKADVKEVKNDVRDNQKAIAILISQSGGSYNGTA